MLPIFKIATAPAAEPVSAAELVDQTKLPSDTATKDATILARLLKSAREHLEHILGISMITQTWTMWLHEWPAGWITIGKPPLQSVASVKYYGTDDTEYTLSTDDYSVDADSTLGRIVLGYGKIWPTATLRTDRPIKITFTAGYGATGASVPEDLRHAIILLADHWYENREPVVVGAGSVSELPFGVQALIEPFRVWSYQ